MTDRDESPAAPSSDGIARTLEYESVRAAVNQYLRGRATSDPEEMRKAFWPGAQIEGVRQRMLVSWTVEEHCADFRGRPDEDAPASHWTIDRIDVSGTAAMAGATIAQGARTFTVYFALLKADGVWRIANTVSSSRPPL